MAQIINVELNSWNSNNGISNTEQYTDHCLNVLVKEILKIK